MKLILNIIIVFCTSAMYSQNILQDVYNKVNQDSLLLFIRILSGDTSAIISTTTQTITSRNSFNTGNEIAADYLLEKLDAYGYTAYKQNFNINGNNVIGEKTGILYPNKIFIICAHYDDLPDSSLAPGADDNGSGVASVIEAARILIDYDSHFTIKFVFFDEEEQGLLGSHYYVNNLPPADTIIGVINIDMIGYDFNKDNVCNISYKDSASNKIMQKMKELNFSLTNGLLIISVSPGQTSSDHLPFWNNNIEAVLLTEHDGDNNPNYHTVFDNISNINKEYLFKMSRLAVVTLASLAMEIAVKVDQSQTQIRFNLEQNYPNPFNPVTNIKYSISKSGKVSLVVYDILGREIKTLINEYKEAGTFNVSFNAFELPSGTYFYKLSSGDYNNVKKMILLK